MPESLSEYLHIEREELDTLGVFNMILNMDSMYFINFMRVRETELQELSNSYSRIRDLFRQVCILLSASRQPNDRMWREALRILKMNEFEELCLGYSNRGTSGRGSGNRLKEKILSTGKEIVDAGISEPEIFEIVGLFEDGIGPDRISDMIGWTIHEDLENFTRRVMLEMNINNNSYQHCEFLNGLIVNPYNRKHILFIPQELLHELPIARDWDDIDRVCLINERLRNEMNLMIGEEWRRVASSLKKDAFRRIVLRNPDILIELIRDYKNSTLDAYNFDSDPIGESVWYFLSKNAARENPLNISRSLEETNEGIIEIVRMICLKFKQLVENNGLNEVLYYNGSPRKERIAQRAFYAIADAYCSANNLDISPEVNSGRGAVDFKFSQGYTNRVLVEVKLTRNQNLVNGFTRQLRAYEASEQTQHSIYLVVDNGGPATRVQNLLVEQANAQNRGEVAPEIIIADAEIRPSASRLH